MRSACSAVYVCVKLNMFIGMTVNWAASAPTSSSRTFDLAPSQPTRMLPVVSVPSSNLAVTVEALYVT